MRVPRGSFVGRDRELATLEAAGAAAEAGNGQLLLIPGEIGIGNSRLVSEFVTRHAQTGGRHAIGASVGEAEPLPYAPLVEAIQGVVAAEPSALTTVPPHQLAQIGQLVPGLHPGPAEGPPPRIDGLGQLHLFEAPLAFGRALATETQPGLLGRASAWLWTSSNGDHRDRAYAHSCRDRTRPARLPNVIPS